MNAQTHTEQRTIADADEMHELGIEIGRSLRAGDLVVLTGPLGAGKTTLVRGVGEGLGVRGPVTSPTFVLARTHPSLTGGPALVHVDAYRLADAAELDDLDLPYEQAVVIVEWGRGMVQPGDAWLEIDIEREAGAALTPVDAVADGHTPVDVDMYVDDEPRAVHLRGFGPRWGSGIRP